MTERGNAKNGHTININGQKDKASSLFDYPLPVQIDPETKAVSCYRNCLPHLNPKWRGLLKRHICYNNNYGFRFTHTSVDNLANPQDISLSTTINEVMEQYQYLLDFHKKKQHVLALINSMLRSNIEEGLKNVEENMQNGLQNVEENLQTRLQNVEESLQNGLLDVKNSILDELKGKLPLRYENVMPVINCQTFVSGTNMYNLYFYLIISLERGWVINSSVSLTFKTKLIYMR